MANTIKEKYIEKLIPEGNAAKDYADLLELEQSSVTWTHKSADTVTVSASSSKSLNFGDVTNAKRAIVKASGAGTLKFNSGTETIPVNGVVVLSGDASNTLTSLTFTDTTGSSNTVSYLIVG